jgi:hypothetical protein
VTKLKRSRFGKDESRILGINRFVLYNNNPNPGAKTKRVCTLTLAFIYMLCLNLCLTLGQPERQIKDITATGLVGPAKPKQFFIVIQEGHKEFKYIYEAQTPAAAGNAQPEECDDMLNAPVTAHA